MRERMRITAFSLNACPQKSPLRWAFLCLLDASNGGSGVPLSGSVGRRPFEIKTDFINDGSPYATAWCDL